MLVEIISEILFLIIWWCNLFDISNPIIAILFVLVNFLLFRFILLAFPFLLPIADLLTRPFRFARFVVRVNTAHTKEKELKIEQDYKQAHFSQLQSDEVDQIELGVYNRLEMNSRFDGSNVYFSSTRLEDNFQVALASWKLLVIMFGGYVVLFPLILLVGSYGYVIHMYFALVLCHVIFPHGADYEMMLYTMIRQGLVPNFLIYWLLFGFFCLFLEFTLRTGGNMILALFCALLWAELYHLSIIPLIRLTWWWKGRIRSDYPELGHIPDSDTADRESPIQSPLLSPSAHNDMNYD
ncbi:MAG: hypothetical protein ACFFDT_34100 [Candidatus Hodarchaeota archaeon]